MREPTPDEEKANKAWLDQADRVRNENGYFGENATPESSFRYERIISQVSESLG